MYQSVSKVVVDVIVAAHTGRRVHVDLTNDNEIMAVRGLCQLVRLTLFLFIYYHYLSSFYKYCLMNVENALTDLSSLELLDLRMVSK